MKDGKNVSCTGCIKQFKKQNNMEVKTQKEANQEFIKQQLLQIEIMEKHQDQQLRLESLNLAIKIKPSDSLSFNARVGQSQLTNSGYTSKQLIADAELIYQYIIKTK